MADGWHALYPFESRRFDRGGGIRMHYVDQGRGDPVLMLHGNPTWSFYYRDLAKTLLGAGHRVIMPDHVGMGLSDKPSDARYQYTLQSRIDDLERLMGAIGDVGPVTLVVHDWGGPIGLCWALRDLARVKSMVILNTAGAVPPAGFRMPWAIGASRGPFGPLLVQGMNMFVNGLIKKGVRHPMAPIVAGGYRHPYRSWGDRLAIMRFIQDIPLKPGDKSYDLMMWLGNNLSNFSGIPTLLGWGMKDFVFGAPFLEQFTLRLPQAEVRRFPNAGHLPLEDSGAELLPMIREFAKKHAVQRQ
jgi:cis-3-alkyl-4-acyloxetan-2-one decarboxylase